MTTIADLTHDPKNARKHGKRNLDTIAKSLEECGAARSIVIDENGVILAGNGLVEAAGQLGIENVQIVQADGNTIIAVQRTGLTAKQKKRLALFDNRSAELAEWDAGALAELVAEDFDFDALFLPYELDSLLESVKAGNDIDDLVQGLPAFAQEDAMPLSSLIVHFYSQSDRDEFAKLLKQTITDKTKSLNFPYIPPMDLKKCSVQDES